MSQELYQPKTFMMKAEETNLNWFLLDATGKTLGRFASEIAKILRGKHKPSFTPHCDNGDGVVIINASKVHVTGAKASRKIYRYYTGYMSGLREIPYSVMLSRKPEYILEHAIKKMMPRTRQSRAQLRRLRIFSGNQHDMQAQKPISVSL
jgi:large subunit ribosomal protein L13